MATAIDIPPAGYPIRFDVPYAEPMSRWLPLVNERVSLYIALMTDAYPPFRLAP